MLRWILFFAIVPIATCRLGYISPLDIFPFGGNTFVRRDVVPDSCTFNPTKMSIRTQDEVADVDILDGIAKDKPSALKILYLLMSYFSGIDDVNKCLKSDLVKKRAPKCFELDRDNIEGHFVDGHKFPLMNPITQHFSCTDPRQEYAILGTPGGDFGEFVFLVSALDQLLKDENGDESSSTISRKLDFTSHEDVAYVLQLLLDLLPPSRSFYFNTDSKALAAWRAETNGGIINPLDKKLLEKVFESSNDKKNNGGIFLVNVFEKLKDLNLEESVVKACIKAFHSIYNDERDPRRSRLMYVVLNGDYKQDAVVNVMVQYPTSCANEQKYPGIVPKVHVPSKDDLFTIDPLDEEVEASIRKESTDLRVSMNHPQAVYFYRKFVSSYFAQVFNLNSVAIEARINTLYDLYMKVTIPAATPVFKEVERIQASDLSLAEFEERFMAQNVPVIIQGVSSLWRSTKEWIREEPSKGINFRSLDCFGEDIAPVVHVKMTPPTKSGERYGEEGERRNDRVKDFLSHWEKSVDAGGGLAIQYLKDWHFTKSFPLYDAYETPVYFQDDWLNEWCDDVSEDDYRFVYMGMKGSYTPLHHDVYKSNSWSCNVIGRKLWILFHPEEEKNLVDRWERDTVSDVYFNETVDADRFPRYCNIRQRFEVIQERGEAIFVPSGWYHQVINLEDTISINHNWFNAFNLDKVHDYIMKSLSDTRSEIQHLKNKDLLVDSLWEIEVQLIMKANIAMDIPSWSRLITRKAESCLDRLRRGEEDEEKMKFNIMKIKNVLEVLILEPYFVYRCYLKTSGYQVDSTCFDETFLDASVKLLAEMKSLILTDDKDR